MAGPTELIVCAFNDQSSAGEVLNGLKKLQKDEEIKITNAAILTKDEQGKPHVHETQDVDSRRGAIFGAVTGGIIGLLGGPVGAVLGAAAGAATGGIAAGKIDMGFEDDALKELLEGMTADSSALITLVEHEWADRLIAELEQTEGKLFRRMLAGEIADKLEAQRDQAGN